MKLTAYIAAADSTAHCGRDAMQQAYHLGEVLAEKGVTVLVSHSVGFPLWVAKGCHESGGQVIGFSPAATMAEHVTVFKLPTDYIDILLYSGFGQAGADLLASRSCDMAIVGCSNLLTVSSVASPIEDHKPIGVYQGDWQDIPLPTGNFIKDSDPARLVDQLVSKSKKVV